jgi:hypothetical protein
MAAPARVRAIALATTMLACLLATGCSDTGCSDGPGIANTLAYVDRWVRVLAVEELSDAQGTRPASLSVATVTPNAEQPPSTEEISIHSSLSEEVSGRLYEGFDVFLALQQLGGRDEAIFVMARNAAAEHFLPGMTCGQESFLREQLGTEYNAVLDSVIGVSSERRVLKILEQHGVGA